MTDETKIQDHPLYKHFALPMPFPLVAAIKERTIIFPSAANYYVYGKSTSKEFREKLLNTDGFKAISYWQSERGMKSLEAEPLDSWDEKKEARFERALDLKFHQAPELKQLLISWNPKKEPLTDQYAREGEPDFIAALIKLRKKYINSN